MRCCWRSSPLQVEETDRQTALKVQLQREDMAAEISALPDGVGPGATYAGALKDFALFEGQVDLEAHMSIVASKPTLGFSTLQHCGFGAGLTIQQHQDVRQQACRARVLRVLRVITVFCFDLFAVGTHS